MKMCEVCKKHPAVNDGMCPDCHEEVVSFENSPEGVVLRILVQILSAAEEGGLRVNQSDAVRLKIMKMLGRTDGAPCGCAGCDRTMTVDDVCFGVVERIEGILDEFCEFHGLDDVD